MRDYRIDIIHNNAFSHEGIDFLHSIYSQELGRLEYNGISNKNSNTFLKILDNVIKAFVRLINIALTIMDEIAMLAIKLVKFIYAAILKKMASEKFDSATIEKIIRNLPDYELVKSQYTLSTYDTFMEYSKSIIIFFSHTKNTLEDMVPHLTKLLDQSSQINNNKVWWGGDNVETLTSKLIASSQESIGKYFDNYNKVIIKDLVDNFDIKSDKELDNLISVAHNGAKLQNPMSSKTTIDMRDIVETVQKAGENNFFSIITKNGSAAFSKLATLMTRTTFDKRSEKEGHQVDIKEFFKNNYEFIMKDSKANGMIKTFAEVSKETSKIIPKLKKSISNLLKTNKNADVFKKEYENSKGIDKLQIIVIYNTYLYVLMNYYINPMFDFCSKIMSYCGREFILEYYKLCKFMLDYVKNHSSNNTPSPNIVESGK